MVHAKTPVCKEQVFLVSDWSLALGSAFHVWLEGSPYHKTVAVGGQHLRVLMIPTVLEQFALKGSGQLLPQILDVTLDLSFLWLFQSNMKSSPAAWKQILGTIITRISAWLLDCTSSVGPLCQISLNCYLLNRKMHCWLLCLWSLVQNEFRSV